MLKQAKKCFYINGFDKRLATAYKCKPQTQKPKALSPKP